METGVWSVAADEAEAASVAVNARLTIAIVSAESAVSEANEGSVATKVATAEITTATKEAAFKRKLIRTHSHAVGRPITPPTSKTLRRLAAPRLRVCRSRPPWTG